MRAVLALGVAALLVGCGGPSEEEVADEYSEYGEGEGESEGQRTFGGYDCTDDCSGHEAGYEWANAQGIDDPSDCGGNSQSFIEGCEAYANENGY